MATELGRKEKALVPVEVWDLAAVEKGKAAVQHAAEDKALVKARDEAKAKDAAGGRDRGADRINRLLFEKGA